MTNLVDSGQYKRKLIALNSSLSESFAHGNNWSALRGQQAAFGPGVLPYLGMILTDVTFIEEHAATGGDLLSTCSALAKALSSIGVERPPERAVRLERNATVQSYLRFLDAAALPETVLYELSAYRCPRHRGDSPARPAVLDDADERAFIRRLLTHWPDKA